MKQVHQSVYSVSCKNTNKTWISDILLLTIIYSGHFCLAMTFSYERYVQEKCLIKEQLLRFMLLLTAFFHLSSITLFTFDVPFIKYIEIKKTKHLAKNAANIIYKTTLTFIPPLTLAFAREHKFKMFVSFA